MTNVFPIMRWYTHGIQPVTMAVATCATLFWLANIFGRWVDVLYCSLCYLGLVVAIKLVDGPIWKRYRQRWIDRAEADGLSQDDPENAFSIEHED